MAFQHFKKSETVILLDIIATLRVKSMNTNQGKVEVHLDNEDIYKREKSVTKVTNHFNQDSAAEIIAIKKLMEEADLDVMLIREQVNREVRPIFHQNPGPELIRMCDGKAKEIRINAVNKRDNNNMRYYTDKVIMKKGKIAHIPVKELIREVDEEEEETNYVKKKFKEREKLFDEMSRINIKKI